MAIDPVTVMMIASMALEATARLAKIVETAQRIKAGEHVTREELEALATEMNIAVEDWNAAAVHDKED